MKKIRMALGGCEEIWGENSILHRTDGPAVIWPHGTEEWYLNGERLTFTQWADKLNLDRKTRLELVMKWIPE